MNNDLVEQKNIKSRIYTVRDRQVMLDRDLAMFYNVETRALKQAVKRNIKRFPADFMFTLTAEEIDMMVSQNVIPSRRAMGGVVPCVFTEEGVANISAVLASERAIEVNIKIMRAFVQMRHFITANANIFQRVDALERRQLGHKMEADKKFDQIFKTIEINDIKPKQGIFYDGQIFDAYKFISTIIRSAKTSIVVIDNYIDESVLVHLAKSRENVEVTLVMKEVSKNILLDVKKFSQQYYPVKIREFDKAHDRFIIIDKHIVYHLGASLKDLGKKWFAFSRMDIEAARMLTQLEG
jgi:hypothetical protein